MNILFQKFPQTVTVDGREYAIVTDFREWIKMHELLMEIDMFTPRVLEILLGWYLDDVPEDIEGAIRALEGFLCLEGMQDELRNEEENDEKGPGKPVFSYSQDAVFIYSAFREIYGIDLGEIEYMHWWKFRALFDGLPADTEIKQRIYYRSLDLKKIKDKDEKKRVQKVQRRIAIKEKAQRVVSDYEIGDAFG